MSFIQRIHESADLWSKYYNETSSYQKKSANEPIESVIGLYYVIDALFTAHNTRCIYLSNCDDNKLLVTSTTFFELSGFEGEGLAIKQELGHCIQYHVCNYNSEATNVASHSYIEFIDSEHITKNYFFESSITTAKCYEAAFLQSYGDVQTSHVNVSNVVGSSNTACELINASIRYCTFYNNTANKARIIHLEFYKKTTMTLCNIVSNKECGTASLNGIICITLGNATITKTIFDSNTGKYLIYYHFWAIRPGTATVSMCYFNDNNISSSTNTDKIKIETTNKFNNIISHFSTNKCEATNYKQETKQDIHIVINDFLLLLKLILLNN